MCLALKKLSLFLLQYKNLDRQLNVVLGWRKGGVLSLNYLKRGNFFTAVMTGEEPFYTEAE